MKHIFIVNPVSGGGRSKKVVDKIESFCIYHDMEFIIQYTKKQMDALNIVNNYKKDKCIIYAVGGDGTLNEVLNGIVGTKNILGIIPCGSGNDFYKTLNKIEEENVTIDIGKINDQYFINIISIGIDAEVANNVSIMKKKRLPNSQIYNISIIYTFFKYKFKDIIFTINNTKKHGKYTMLTVCNGKFYGNGFPIGTKASLTDGLFDIYFVNKISKAKIPQLLLKLKNGVHDKSPEVNMERAKEIVIESDEDIICNIDGEIIEDKRFDIKLLESKIPIYNNRNLIEYVLSDLDK